MYEIIVGHYYVSINYMVAEIIGGWEASVSCCWELRESQVRAAVTVVDYDLLCITVMICKQLFYKQIIFK